MKLKDCKNWKAVHFEDRTILKTDNYLYHKEYWNDILDLEVEPMMSEGHYRVVERKY